MFNDEEIKLLGLSSRENHLLSGLLGEDALLITAIARTTRLKRTTLYSLLDRLHERGLVIKSRRGKRWYWQLAPEKQIQEKLFALAERHRTTPDPHEKELGIIASQDTEYKLYRGQKKLGTIYAELAYLPRGTRLFGIQPNESIASVIKNAPSKIIANINESFKNRGIIIEAILAEDFVEQYVRILRTENIPPAEILRTFGERLAITTYVPKGTLDFNAELIFYGNTLLILDWRELSAVVIKNKNVVGILKAMFDLAKLAGRRVDQNKKVADVIGPQ
ncbi:MAG: iclR-type protein [Patescibacteria group bacterium]|nr:iclR-type protein [Patescibacteria group bacterium]